jgi:hypothetical protein
MTPYELVFNLKSKPNPASIPEWGRQVCVRSSKGTKLDGRGLQAYWVAIFSTASIGRRHAPFQTHIDDLILILKCISGTHNLEK